MRERLFRKKTPDEGTGWTINSKAGWIVTGLSVLVLLVSTILMERAIEDQASRVAAIVSVVMIWATLFTLFAKWESERS